MPSSHIPGIPYLQGPSVLGRLTTASAFLQLPRSPVKFRPNERSRALLSTPASRLPRRIAPAAPRRRRFQAAPVASAIPFPSLAKFKPRSSSPPRYCVWTTPSMSKNGVTRALQNRRFNPSSPEPTRIPVSASIRSALPVIPCPPAPRKRVDFVNPVTATVPSNVASPSKVKASRRTFFRNPERVARANLYASLVEAHKSIVSRSAKPLRSILVRPDSDKVRAKKGVRFGSTEIREVDFWIDRKRNVFQDGGLWKMGRLQGWRVTPLETPNEDGETEKYMTMWGHDHSSVYYHHPDEPECTHEGCLWQAIALFARYCRRKKKDLGCEGENLLRHWSEYRQRARDEGYDLL
ncbi:hypothetical protein TMatcc_011286 [Talaromyces marneffei ATCC 18224]|uniref:Uncharacterized protein n=2 Tax=Talaromyces marneffei TaxID=37727 RepID=B6QEZ3_TALMQ|nr:uncharacterized protein EYB26_005043 [Talaromyces marneffei]EEA25048.1 conserved hypothetical protein [Talaromyces marneffei ATCC 18224]KAE8552491.1 hypothetical protein EYB25_003869 [Talaromyces marneffei]QGA17372.1 hypothetical protein EYB26_005043 [Talaromyces marneffei]